MKRKSTSATMHIIEIEIEIEEIKLKATNSSAYVTHTFDKQISTLRSTILLVVVVYSSSS